MNKRATARALGAAIVALGLVGAAATAHADIKCRQTVAKESAKATQGIAKALQKCEQGVVDGKVTGPCPDSGKAAPAITKAKSKLKAAIVKACATSTGEFAFGRCPNETGATGSCGGILIKTKADEGDCLGCLAEHNALELFHKVLYGSIIPPGTDKIVAKCQSSTGKAVIGFYAGKSKALAKCHDDVLKGKITGACPDTATSDAINKAESKKVAAITKACCGDKAVLVCSAGPNMGATCTVDSQCPGSSCSACGGATCADTPATVVSCSGGTNNGKPCSPTCAGGANAGVTCTVDSQCPASTCTGASIGCPGGGSCISMAAGDVCEAPSDCGRCRGGTTHGQPCRASGQCQSDPGSCNPGTLHCIGGTNDGQVCGKCVAGANANVPCTTDSECPTSTCAANGAACPSVGGGTCVGTSGLCQGSDDVNPLTQFGFPSPCPGISLGGAPITLTGVTGATLLKCLDTQADQRASCQDAAGATFASDSALPPYCVDATPECASSGSSVIVTVSLDIGTTNVAGVSISLGYQNVVIPGVGDVSGRVTNLQSGFIAAEDRDDALVTSVTDTNPLSDGNLYTVQFDTCSGGPAPTTADFGCVVRSASSDVGADVLDGASCHVVSVM